MSYENNAVPQKRAEASADARKGWERPALRVLGAKFARNTLNVCGDNGVQPNRDQGHQVCS